MSLETDLKNALRRVPAPEGLAERVLAGVRGGQTIASVPGKARLPVLHIAATLLLAAILGGWGAHERMERRREGERARQQVLLALRIAGSKVAHARHEVSRQIQR